MLKLNILIKDNFLKNIEQIRNKGLLSKYYSSTDVPFEVGWSGDRTKEFDTLNDTILTQCENQILDTVEKFFKIKNFLITTYFHISYQKTKQELEDFENKKYHSDMTEYAGVLYLYQNPPEGTGTSILNEDQILKIENVYNRLICYPGNYIHAPSDLFGNTIENGRMTITFFVSKKFKARDFLFNKI